MCLDSSFASSCFLLRFNQPSVLSRILHWGLRAHRSLRQQSTAVCSAQKKSHHVSATERAASSTRLPKLIGTEITENLQRINAAMGLQDYLLHEHITLRGKTVMWGIESEWTMKWCMDGRFYEQFRNEEFTHEWGHDGNLTWYADAGGRVSRLELDEGEVCALCAWVRTGFWVTEEAQKRLVVQQKQRGSTACFIRRTLNWFSLSR